MYMHIFIYIYVRSIESFDSYKIQKLLTSTYEIARYKLTIREVTSSKIKLPLANTYVHK